MGIQKFVFFSIHNCDKHPEVPLMQIKFCTEKFLRDIGLNHVIIRLCGFMQVLSTPHRSCYNPFFTFCYLFLVYLKLVCYTYTLHITLLSAWLLNIVPYIFYIWSLDQGLDIKVGNPHAF